jgi:hypothetical protein
LKFIKIYHCHSHYLTAAAASKKYMKTFISVTAINFFHVLFCKCSDHKKSIFYYCTYVIFITCPFLITVLVTTTFYKTLFSIYTFMNSNKENTKKYSDFTNHYFSPTVLFHIFFLWSRQCSGYQINRCSNDKFLWVWENRSTVSANWNI